MTALSAIVLAGGQSSRMGQDKALLIVNGMPLLRRTCEIGLACTPTVFVVTSRVEAYRAIAPPGCQFVQEQSLATERFPPGPLVGFAQGLAQVTTPWVLLLACDLPHLQADILHRWQAQLPDDNGAIALIPRTEQGWEPLCGFYQRRCLDFLETYLQTGGRSFQGWLQQMPVQPITWSSIPAEAEQEQAMLFNCNTPADWQRVQQITTDRASD